MTRMVEGIAQLSVARTEVFCLTDGRIDLGTEVFPEVDPARREAAHPGSVQVAVNCHLLRHADGQLDLVDTGCGPAIYDGAGGRLIARLAELGIAPEQIDRILFTHLHGDHAAGALTPDGSLMFPRARIVMQAAERAYWQDRPDSAGGRLLAAAADRITTVGPDADLGQGVSAWSLPGHTPGHMGLMIGGQLALIGDVAHSYALQLPDPAVHTRYDIDSAVADASRLAAFDRIAAAGLIFSGSHLPGPEKFLRLAALDGGGFRSLPQ
ncbi:MBL fold metallo-hydrolase [Pseudodonghicola flavimaris]|uniref:MBL fold metallo-hydrolase n=1 Tax=Pseudodonghicola flavimaris TaxID=3050036 RepID=A0ABT7F1N1_9RHOB|nr:MBL fold metallo-hydrolase [Pseudodonghicola flavimaris]MDK3018480.1 MBL fold metallo-hydrolase [Pseudodonghicola flavimaris]